MINNKFFTGVLIAAAALTGALTQASSASAFTWNNAWTQSTISSGASQGFNHQPFQQFVQTERLALQNAGLRQVDVNNLFLRYDHDVKVSFINEGAGYRNQLAFKSTGATNTSNLLFNDISCAGAGCVMGGANTLKLGDTVKAGKIAGGSTLDFFLRSDGFNKGNNAYIYGTKNALNADQLQHAVAYTYGGRYLVLGFEDLYGTGTSWQGKFGERSDRDFNDTVFAVDIGENNVRYLNGEKVPEPAAAVGLIGLGAAAWMKRRRAAK